MTRHPLFEAARVRAGWSVRQLWLDYLALGGTYGAFEIEAYLEGLTLLDPGQQDVLAVALNERLDDLYRAARVPYLFSTYEKSCRPQSATEILAGLIDQQQTTP